MPIPVVHSVQNWYCPRCGKRETTTAVVGQTYRMHTCPKLRYLASAPMLPEGVAAKVELVEWGDYVGKEHVQLDPERGRPLQSIVTTRDAGQDTIVFAPAARATSD